MNYKDLEEPNRINTSKPIFTEEEFDSVFNKEFMESLGLIELSKTEKKVEEVVNPISEQDEFEILRNRAKLLIKNK
jgi:hypothetical protein